MAEGSKSVPEIAGSVQLLGPEAARGLEKALRVIGAICATCDRPTYHHTLKGPATTYEFKLCEVTLDRGKPMVTTSSAFCCSRKDCEGFQRWSGHPNVIAVRTFPSWEIIVPPKPESAERV